MEKLSALLEDTAESIEDADAALVEKVAPSDKAVVQTLSLIGEIGDQPPMRALCASLIVIGLIRRDAKLAMAGARMLTAHTIATKAKNILKKRVDRVLPDSREGKDDHRVKAGVSASHDETSFPSGHSAGALAVGTAFGRAFPEHRVAAVGSATAIALLQVPRRSHYLSDVIVGSAIGLVCECALNRLIRSLGLSGRRRRA
jgi:membrane-associated phospholipid phosphatase